MLDGDDVRLDVEKRADGSRRLESRDIAAISPRYCRDVAEMKLGWHEISMFSAEEPLLVAHPWQKRCMHGAMTVALR